MPHTIREYILWTETRFLDAGLYFGHGTDNAHDEAVWLVTAALHLSPDRLEAQLDRPLERAQAERVRQLIQTRISTRKPAAYLLNEARFAGLPFYVDERVLIPRSHLAEFIEERFQPWIKLERVQRVLDVGTGSGCIAVAVARAFPRAQVDASDIDEQALAVAHRNIDKYGLSDRIRLIQSDVFAALAGKTYDIIISNPPYVTDQEMSDMPAEYRHEPAQALAAGSDGLDVLTRLVTEAGAYLNTGGLLIVETGNAADSLQEKFSKVPFIWLTTITGDESVFVLQQ